MCDFWARVKLRKMATDEVAQDMYLSIHKYDNPGHTKIDDAIIAYWAAFGLKNIERLCEEEPDLCSKINTVQQKIISLLA